MSAKSRRRERELGRRKQPGETKADAAARGVWSPENRSRPWRAPLRRIIGRKRVELKREGYTL